MIKKILILFPSSTTKKEKIIIIENFQKRLIKTKVNTNSSEILNKSCLPKITFPKNEINDIKEKSTMIEIKSFTPREILNRDNNDDFKISPRSVSFNQSVMNCLICFDKSPDAVLMECGHGGEV